jgi:hypothetical protein
VILVEAAHEAREYVMSKRNREYDSSPVGLCDEVSDIIVDKLNTAFRITKLILDPKYQRPQFFAEKSHGLYYNEVENSYVEHSWVNVWHMCFENKRMYYAYYVDATLDQFNDIGLEKWDPIEIRETGLPSKLYDLAFDSSNGDYLTNPEKRKFLLWFRE